jgi:ribosomal protein S15P/S13E
MYLQSGPLGEPPAARPGAPVAPPPARPTLAEAVTRSLRVLAARPLEGEPTKRLRCLLGIIQDPQVDDAYINGYDYFMQRVTTRLSPEQFAALLHRARADLTTHWFGPDKTDDVVRTGLRLLDERIFSAIHYMNRLMYTHGSAMAQGKVQIKDWMARQQRNRNSIYSCYGGVRDRR